MPPRYRFLLLAGLMLVAASRAPYVLLHGRFWAEEGSLYFVHMKHGGFWYVARPIGYFHAFCNIAAWLAARAPLEQAPLVTAWLSLGVIAALVWAALWLPSELLTDARAKIITAVLLVVGPLAIPVVWLNSVNAQTYLGVLAILLLFVDVNAVRRGTFVAIVVLLGIAGVSGLYAAVLAPLFAFNAWRDRSRRRLVLAGLVSACGVVQLIVVQASRASGDLAQGRLSFQGFGPIARDVSAWHVGTFVLGTANANRIHASSHVQTAFGLALLTLFAVGVGALLLAVLAVVPRARVAFLLVAAFGLEEVLIVFGSFNGAGGRYAVVPVALLVLMAVHGLTAPPRWASTAAAAFCVAALVFGCSNFWTTNPAMLRCIDCAEWNQQVAAWRAGTTTTLVIWPSPGHWRIRLPHSVPAAAAPSTTGCAVRRSGRRPSDRTAASGTGPVVRPGHNPCS